MLLKIMDLSSKASIVVAMIGVLIMLIIVVADVLSRGLLNIAIPGVDTVVAAYLMVSSIFLPLAALQLTDGNIAISVLWDSVPFRLQRIFDLIAHALALIFFTLLGWLYFNVAIDAFEVNEYVTGTWNVPIWPARILMPIGLFLGATAALAKLLISLIELTYGHEYKDSNLFGDQI